MVRSVVLPMVIVLSMALGAEAASYTIASDGTDEAACNAAEACASIRRASELLVPGDTLDVRSALGSPWLGQVMTDASQHLGQLRGGLLLSTGEDQPHGFVRLAMTWSTTLRPQFAAAAKALPNLADVLNKSSGIESGWTTTICTTSPAAWSRGPRPCRIWAGCCTAARPRGTSPASGSWATSARVRVGSDACPARTSRRSRRR